MAYRCPGCGRTDQQIPDYSRRELRMSLGSRVNRRRHTKSGDATRPRVKLAKKMRVARAKHEEACRA